MSIDVLLFAITYGVGALRDNGCQVGSVGSLRNDILCSSPCWEVSPSNIAVSLSNHMSSRDSALLTRFDISVIFTTFCNCLADKAPPCTLELLFWTHPCPGRYGSGIAGASNVSSAVRVTTYFLHHLFPFLFLKRTRL